MGDATRTNGPTPGYWAVVVDQTPTLEGWRYREGLLGSGRRQGSKSRAPTPLADEVVVALAVGATLGEIGAAFRCRPLIPRVCIARRSSDRDSAPDEAWRREPESSWSEGTQPPCQASSSLACLRRASE